MADMIRTQIYLSTEQHEALKKRSEGANKTMASMIREAVNQYLAEEQSPSPFPADDPLFDLIGVLDSSPTDVSVNHDAYLYADPHK